MFRNVKEIIGKKEIEHLMETKKKVRIYWGISPTGKMHIGYLIPLMKIIDFVREGCEVIILLADLHAYLDSKTNWEDLEKRTTYYQTMIKHFLDKYKVKVTFVCGRDFQLKQEYMIDMFRYMSMCGINHCMKAGSEVVRQEDNPKMNSLIYPILQSLDEEYLHVDIQFGGIDQRKIFMFSQKFLPRLGYKKRYYIMTPLLSLHKDKMSASSPYKICLTASNKEIQQSIQKVYCEEKSKDSPLYPFVQYMIFPHHSFMNCSSYEEFLQIEVHPKDLKDHISNFLIDMLSSFRSYKALEKEVYG